MRFKPHGIDDGIRSSAVRQFLEHVLKVLGLAVVDGLRRCMLPNVVETVLLAIDDDYSIRTQMEGACRRHLPDWTGTPDGDGLTAFDLTIVCREITGGKRVGQHDRLVRRQTLRNLESVRVGVGDAH